MRDFHCNQWTFLTTNILSDSIVLPLCSTADSLPLFQFFAPLPNIDQPRETLPCT